MFKFFFIGLVVILAVTTIPAIRSRVMPPVARALGPTGEKIATPVKRWKAKNGANNLLREMRADATAGRKMPQPFEFTVWARQEMRDPTAGTDPWGGLYYLKPGRNLMTVGSPGPDGLKNTADDVVVNSAWER